MMRFEFISAPIKGLVLVKPEIRRDARGLASELYKHSELAKAGIKTTFVQENRSVSDKGVLRGLHYQRAPHAQAKLVRCARGRVFDVAVDLRRASGTFGRHFSVELSPENGLQLYIPAGFAHGFYSLAEGSEVLYRCSKEYAPEHDRGVRWNDPELAVDWPCARPKLSARDAGLPFLREAVF
jgi:dTDP-4-dehydrorhamnose 3,5-epimerase